MKPIPTTGPDAPTVVIQSVNKQAFRFYGNEIFDHGYCEPIGAGIHVYTAQLAALFHSKTTELRSTVRRYCVGFKQAEFYRVGYDAGRKWFREKHGEFAATELYGPDAVKFVRQIHHLAFHSRTLFDVPDRPGRGVYGVKLLDVPINKRALRWAGHYAAITAGIIDIVTQHTAVFHRLETCALLDSSCLATMEQMVQRVEYKIVDKVPICERRTYLIERQPKLPIDMQDLINALRRQQQSRLIDVTRETLPEFLAMFNPTIEERTEACTLYRFERDGLVNLLVHVGEQLSIHDGTEGATTVYWEGEDPAELIDQLLLAANLQLPGQALDNTKTRNAS